MVSIKLITPGMKKFVVNKKTVRFAWPNIVWNDCIATSIRVQVDDELTPNIFPVVLKVLSKSACIANWSQMFQRTKTLPVPPSDRQERGHIVPIRKR